MKSLQGLFVVGTDTGVGKTLVACSIIRRLRTQGLDAVAFKPIVTGAYTTSPVPLWSDAESLHMASDAVEPLDRICPVRLEPPLSPVPAARAHPDGFTLPTLAQQIEHVKYLTARHKIVIAEGIGGLLVPLSTENLLLDLIKATGFPVVLVSRAGLGTINHTLLSLRELERSNIPVAALVMNVTRRTDSNNVPPSCEEIERVSGRKFDAVVSFSEIEADTQSSLKDRIAAAERALDARWDALNLFTTQES